jgi:DNA-binding MarR family transcriptional regulator
MGRDSKMTTKEFEQEGRVVLTDTKTGKNIVPAITLIRHKWKGESFFIGFQDAFITLAKMKVDKEQKKRVGAEAKNVLLFLLGKIEYENRVGVSQIEIARELGMKKQNVSRAIKALIEEGVLKVEDPLRKRRLRMTVSDKYVWRGKLNTRPKEQKTRKKPATKRTRKKSTKQQ